MTDHLFPNTPDDILNAVADCPPGDLPRAALLAVLLGSRVPTSHPELPGARQHLLESLGLDPAGYEQAYAIGTADAALRAETAECQEAVQVAEAATQHAVDEAAWWRRKIYDAQRECNMASFCAGRNEGYAAGVVDGRRIEQKRIEGTKTTNALRAGRKHIVTRAVTVLQ